ncbi:reverse transcriptase domain-containing protein [Trichonephila clavipes]|nr:reverse transcriptase domain-containing protein [Trichonephila clavipes]
MFEMKRALSSAHNTSPGPDGIFPCIASPFVEDSLVSLLYLFNRIWREQVYPTQWQEAIVIPILKPGKDPKNPSQLSTDSTHEPPLLHYTLDDLQISCEGSDMRMIERQLQTAVNNILKWCDTNGHSISASKVCCVHFCRKRGIHPDPEIRIRDMQIPVVPDRCEKVFKPLEGVVKHLLGSGSNIITRVYQAIVLSRIDYGCVAYGSACDSTLQKTLDPVHHMALRICSGAFRTSPVQSLYVICHPASSRSSTEEAVSGVFIFRSCSACLHPLQNVCIMRVPA